jgi:hypothetical protein
MLDENRGKTTRQSASTLTRLRAGPYERMGEFAGMKDFEVVAYLTVVPKTAPINREKTNANLELGHALGLPLVHGKFGFHEDHKKNKEILLKES